MSWRRKRKYGDLRVEVKQETKLDPSFHLLIGCGDTKDLRLNWRQFEQLRDFLAQAYMACRWSR